MKRRGSCHCQKVVWEFEVDGPIKKVMCCNCSFCTKRAALIVSLNDFDKIKVLEGEEHLTSYGYHSNVAKHFFCLNCGIYTFHRKRSNPQEGGVNLGTIEGEDPIKGDYEILYLDGQNHPLDKT